MKIFKCLFYGVILSALIGLNIQCKNNKQENSTEVQEVLPKENLRIIKSEFGKMPDGTIIEKYHLKNTNGVALDVITYGGRITSLKVPNKHRDFENVVLGFDNLDDYLNDNPFFGALIGRFGNRIAKGKFSLNDKTFTLATNDGSNHLHGGIHGFDRVVWTAEAIEGADDPSLRLKYFSKDGEEGYPGNLSVTVVYTLTKENTLEVLYKATTDKTTVVNLTQHAYFNLTGDFTKTILKHDLVINADTYLPVDETLIPTGEIRKVAGTPFDFRTTKGIGKDIEVDNKQLILGKGYDHCWIVNGEKNTMRQVASLYEQSSGRFMEVFSEEPGIQLYTGNFLDSTLPMPNGGEYGHRTGLCLETQHYPDTPNQKGFPSVVLTPNDTYTTKTAFRFSVK
ncbi:aldose epimerase family protein [Algibacter sp. L3A6]|uniref:aldose epimerase family protein n=1 Tax=Algibacter sp. L3A6 TaxID=2686366 RepID=UPI00131E7FEE|nr:aldose epimerase family protein [Algibacter sp. L3A6]